MSVDNKRFYNIASATRLGWDPSWFEASEFDGTLIKKVKEFQEEYKLKVDGLVGPMTYARLITDREAKVELVLTHLKERSDELEKKNSIVCAGASVNIEWDKIVNVHSPDALVLPQENYQAGPHADRKPTMIVTHWDAALSAKSCFNILKRRGVSSHFVIDNDGTIYQLVDVNDVAWHAGKVNSKSIGIDFSNAYYEKYQKYYRRKGFGNRPLLDDSVVHGVKLEQHLGYYPVQERAYKALVGALAGHYDIPLQCPDEAKVHPQAQKGTYEGVVCHYHVSRAKIDCAGLELSRLLREIELEAFAESDN